MVVVALAAGAWPVDPLKGWDFRYRLAEQVAKGADVGLRSFTENRCWWASGIALVFGDATPVGAAYLEQDTWGVVSIS